MNVRVKAFAIFREVMEKEVERTLPERATISDLLSDLALHYPGFGDMAFEAPGVLKKFVNILHNGRNIEFLKNLDTPLADGDLIALFPPMGGG
jgi:molybdopterin synthase sulfur carrier subunit